MMCIDVWRLVLSFDCEWGPWIGSSLMTTCRSSYAAAVWSVRNTAAGRCAVKRALLAGGGGCPPYSDELLRELSDAEIERAFYFGIPEVAVHHSNRYAMSIIAAEACDFETVGRLVGEADATVIQQYYTQQLLDVDGLSSKTALETIALHNDDPRVLERLMSDAEWVPNKYFKSAITTRERCGRHLALRHLRVFTTWDISYFSLSQLSHRDACAVIEAIDNPFVVFSASRNPDERVFRFAEARHPRFVRHNAVDVVRCALMNENDMWLEIAANYRESIDRNGHVSLMGDVLQRRGDLEFTVAAGELGWSASDFWRRPAGREPDDCALTLEWAVDHTRGDVPQRACAMLAHIADGIQMKSSVLSRIPKSDPAHVSAALAARNPQRAVWLHERCREDMTTSDEHKLGVAKAAVASADRKTIEAAMETFALRFRHVSPFFNAKTPHDITRLALGRYDEDV